MASRKIYSRDFKLKVLEYYFKHGGDKKFGIRAKTAHHFCIDHKTVSRMLCNPDIVKKARRTLAKKNSSSGCKPLKPPSLKLMGQPFGGVREVGVSDTSSEGGQNPSPGPSKVSHISPQEKRMPSEEKKLSSTDVPVIELPEDPDFSLLKKTIESSASAAANIARLLITGTSEVKRIITNECDLIFECKVCRNLFRSVINFLAHKRVYCQEAYMNVKNIFHKDTGLSMSNESSTIIVEPEPPPSDTLDLGVGQTSDKSELKIDKIASRLAKRENRSENEFSSSTYRGSSDYFNKLQEVNESRKSMSGNCSVLLQDIAGVSSAVYQTFIPPNSSKCMEERTQEAVKEIHQRKRDQPVQLDSEGKIIKRKEAKLAPTTTTKTFPSSSKEGKEAEEESLLSCSSCSCSFSNQKLLDSHIEEVHGVERTVYTCPICNMVFLSIWGCVKHLIRTHKKKKHQRERLKHVICSRAYKKLFTAKDIARHTHKSCAQVTKMLEKKDEVNASSKELSKEGISRVNLPVEEEPSTFHRNKTTTLPHGCPRCGQTFQTPTAMGAHLQYCSLASLQNNFQSETPEKKIEIQIRKDYKKEASGPPPQSLTKGTNEEENFNLEIQSRIKEVCILNRLFCIPCKRRYHSITVLKRHAAQHLGWTRFSCARCTFRSYEKYMCVQHCITVHKASDRNIERMILKEEKLGSLKYYLTPNRVNKVSSENFSTRTDREEDNKKAEYLQNGDCSSPSECSASIISDDSVSLKGEFENQDLEKANVAYRELIENLELGTEGKSTQERERRENRESREGELRTERPQRIRKAVEQKDFVYEPLRASCSFTRNDDDNKSVGGTTTMRHRSFHPVIMEPERSAFKRKGVSPVIELNKTSSRNSPNAETTQNICNGRESPSVDFGSSTSPSALEGKRKEPSCSSDSKSPKERRKSFEKQENQYSEDTKYEPSEDKTVFQSKIIENSKRIKKEPIEDETEQPPEDQNENIFEDIKKESLNEESESLEDNKASEERIEYPETKEEPSEENRRHSIEGEAKGSYEENEKESFEGKEKFFQRLKDKCSESSV